MTSAARSTPHASMTASRSCIHSLSVGMPWSGTGSDRPTPRRSKVMTRLNEAMASSTGRNGDAGAHSSSAWENQSTETTTSGPAPQVR